MQNRSRILWALSIVAVFLVVQLIGAWISGSLSLLADAGHMASDLTGLVVALVALSIALKPATKRHTFGFRRFEVLGALANALILLGVSLAVGYAGVSRLIEGVSDTEVQSIPMLIVASIGLLANIAAMLVLRSGAKDSINLRGAYLEVFADTLGSLAVIMAALVIMFTGFVQADAIASLLIALMILPRALSLLRDVSVVLSQSAPKDADTKLIRKHILEQEGVVAVHDLHIWSITTGESVFTVHVVVEDEVFSSGQTGELLTTLSSCLSDHFDVEHSTFQFEPLGHREPDEIIHP
ncbi:MAG: cation diffusion facilitator family transporter [Microbacteriaceae bacterium]